MNNPAKYHFFVDAKKYETAQASLTGAQIKAMVPGFNPAYQLFLECNGQDADKPISDVEGVLFDAAGGVRKFYSVPPATFGRI
jgi:hypothetical protein